jgi:hypothetical protein
VTLTVSELAALDHDSFYFEGDGHAILGRGLAATHRIQQGEQRSGEHDVSAELRARRTVAFVTFPYDRQEPAVVRIPETDHLVGAKQPDRSAQLDDVGPYSYCSHRCDGMANSIDGAGGRLVCRG